MSLEKQDAVTQQVVQAIDDVAKDTAFLATVSAFGLDALVGWRIAARFLGVTTRQAIQSRVSSGELQRRNGLYRIGDVQSYISGSVEDLDHGIALVQQIAKRTIRKADKRQLTQDLRATGVTLTDLYTMGRVSRSLKRN